MVNYSKKADYACDDVIFWKGEEGREMFVVLRGVVGIYTYSIGGDLVKLDEITEGAYFGEGCLVGIPKRTHTAIAETDCLLISITKTTFQSFIQSYPETALQIMKSLAFDVNKAYDAIKSIKGKIRSNYTGVKEIKRSYKEPLEDFADEDGVLPKDRMSYAKMAKISDKEILKEEETTCPVCQNRFKVFIPRFTKLVPLAMDGFNKVLFQEGHLPLYSIIVCPECNFARLFDDPVSITEEEKRQLIEKSYKSKGKGFSGYSSPRMYDEVFEAYYLAIYCYGRLKNTAPEIYARLWLDLSRLYRSCNDMDKYNWAVSRALSYYNADYLNRLPLLSDKEDMEFNFLLGQLNKVSGKNAKAKWHFGKALELGEGLKEASELVNLSQQELSNLNKNKKTKTEVEK